MTLPAPAPEPDDRTCDRTRIEEAIIAAARAMLVEKGFGGWGVNAIARAAGCDKQLIYRYFGGLDGLAEALGVAIAEETESALASLPAADGALGREHRRLCRHAAHRSGRPGTPARRHPADRGGRL
jgi:AcrR family transcriptional regulator